MSFKSSYSQNSTYISCPKFWYNSYVLKLKGLTEGASLYFGSAMDAAVESMLKNEPNYMNRFHARWHTAMSNGKPKQLFDADDIIFGYNDFDESLLDKHGDTPIMEDWAKQLGLIPQTETPDFQKLVGLYRETVKLKKNSYRAPTDEQIKYYNRLSWLSMNHKGRILITAFRDQFYPKIKKVISTQNFCNIKDPSTGDSIVGVIDMVLEIEGYDKPIIFDLKTAAMPYTQDQIELTDQLTLYAGMKGADYQTNLVGYVVLCKNIPKDIVAYCNKCNGTRNGRHKTCDALSSSGDRCHGNWIETKVPKPVVQVLVESKTPEQINDLFQDISNIMVAMKNSVIFKNTSKCNNWYGSKCQYYDLCHKNDPTGLVKK